MQRTVLGLSNDISGKSDCASENPDYVLNFHKLASDIFV